MDKNTDVETQLALLQRDIANFSTLFTKLDVSVEKMTEVSNNINRLLSIHEQRIQTLSEQDRLLELKLEKNNNNFTNEIKEIQSELRDLNKDITNMLKDHEEGIKSELTKIADAFAKQQKEHNEDVGKKFEDINKRISVLERWRWTVVGGALILGWIISKVPISVLFS
jgi:serine/threonine-protein kinase RIO1